MTKSELIKTVIPIENLRGIEKVVTILLNEISEHLAKGGRVELRDFGVFEIRKRVARIGRNPKTDQSIKVTAKSVPFFKAGKQLKQKINEEL